MKQTKETTLTPEQRAALEELGSTLGIDPRVLESMVGRPVQGSATYSTDGGFRFSPKRSLGPRETELKTTRRGSKLVQTQGTGRVILRVSCPDDTPDPDAYIIDEVNALMKGRTDKTVNLKGRWLSRSPTHELRLNSSEKRLEMRLSVELEPGCSPVNRATERFAQLLYAITSNDKEIRKIISG